MSSSTSWSSRLSCQLSRCTVKMMSSCTYVKSEVFLYIAMSSEYMTTFNVVDRAVKLQGFRVPSSSRWLMRTPNDLSSGLSILGEFRTQSMSSGIGIQGHIVLKIILSLLCLAPLPSLRPMFESSYRLKQIVLEIEIILELIVVRLEHQLALPT